MAVSVLKPARVQKKSIRSRIYTNRYLYCLILPTVIYFFVFKLLPMFGLVMAFQDYSPAKGFFGSPFVGFKYFSQLVTSENFYLMLRNTLVINGLSLILFFPLPIILSIMLNEVKHDRFKKFNQSILYLPHFMSWVIIASLTFFLLSVDLGIVNKILVAMGQEPQMFLMNPNCFWIIILCQNIWRETGWGTILFLAALSGVDTQMYEAARIDGATRFQQILYITIPSLAPTIVILLILRIGNMFDVSLEQINLMQNPLVMDVSEVFDTYSYRMGIQQGRYSLGAAVGMFKGIIAYILVTLANKISKKLGQDGIY